MDETSATITPPSRRSRAYLLRDRPPPTTPNPGFHDFSGDDDSIPFPVAMSKSPISPSPRFGNQVAAQERLLLLSHSPIRRRKSLVLIQEENLELGAKSRRRSKNRSAAVITSVADVVLAGCGSPRNTRRARRRLEKEIIARDDVTEHDVVKARRRRQTKNGSSRDEKPSLVLREPHPGDVEKAIGDVSLDGIKEAISELIMWKNFAKSSLWFGLGTLCFTSSCFSRDVNFCVVSAVSNLGLLLLAVAFIRDSVPRRSEEKARCAIRIKEEDITKAIRLVLPVINAAIVVIQEIFSGEPSKTLTVEICCCFSSSSRKPDLVFDFLLKVAPVLLFTAKYGHCITLWRLLAAGFFIGFTVPKLYSTYSSQIHRHAESMGKCLLEGWEACRRRKFLGVSAAMMLWNLLSVKTRIIAAFTCLVLLRYYRQRCDAGEAIVPEKQEEENPQEQNAGNNTMERSASDEADASI